MRRTLPAFLLVFGVFGLSTLAGALCAVSAWGAGREPYAAWETLARALHQLETRYVEPVDEQRLVWAALAGVADALDPHSAFLTPEAWRALQAEDRSAYDGVGIRVAPVPEGLGVVEVVPGSPAEGRLRPGDLVTRVDGEPVADLAALHARLGGPRGSPVVLGILRDGASLDVPLVRDLVHEPAAWADLLPGRVGYVALVHFDEGAGAEFDAALTALERRAGAPLAALVLDLRGNPGGLLPEAVRVVDRFLPEGPIVETRGRDPRDAEIARATPSPTDLSLPVVVLVDGGSASASEIVAGALRARGRATLVGTRTWGKGSVQTVWTFEDGSAFKATVARYVLPDGALIDHREGLRPDVEVRRPEDEHLDALVAAWTAQVDADPALAPADRDRALAALARVAERGPDRTRRAVLGVPVADRLGTDPQLARAIELATPPARR